jgi:hypothetical protein
MIAGQRSIRTDGLRAHSQNYERRDLQHRLECAAFERSIALSGVAVRQARVTPFDSKMSLPSRRVRFCATRIARSQGEDAPGAREQAAPKNALLGALDDGAPQPYRIIEARALVCNRISTRMGTGPFPSEAAAHVLTRTRPDAA